MDVEEEIESTGRLIGKPGFEIKLELLLEDRKSKLADLMSSHELVGPLLSFKRDKSMLCSPFRSDSTR